MHIVFGTLDEEREQYYNMIDSIKKSYKKNSTIDKITNSHNPVHVKGFESNLQFAK